MPIAPVKEVKRISVDDIRATFGDEVADRLVAGTRFIKFMGGIELSKEDLEDVQRYFEQPTPGNTATASRVMRLYFQFMPWSRRAFLGWITKALHTMEDQKTTTFSLNGHIKQQRIKLTPATSPSGKKLGRPRGRRKKG